MNPQHEDPRQQLNIIKELLALKAIEEERVREAVDRYKQKLREPWYKKIFPFRIKLTIERK